MQNRIFLSKECIFNDFVQLLLYNNLTLNVHYSPQIEFIKNYYYYNKCPNAWHSNGSNTKNTAEAKASTHKNFKQELIFVVAVVEESEFLLVLLNFPFRRIAIQL